MKLRYLLLFFGIAAGAIASGDSNIRFCDDDTICEKHPQGGIGDCYEREFRPTKEFQIVRKGQEIPKGLHVKINMQTGQKEAKIYDPTKDQDPVNAVAVYPDTEALDHDVDLVPDEPLRDETPQLEHQAQQVLEEMRKAKAHQKETIKVPVGSSEDRKLFDEKTKIIKHWRPKFEKADHGRPPHDSETTPEARQELYMALVELEELCHDIYWGQELVKDHEVLETMDLFSRAGYTDEMSRALGLIATAVRNNGAAMIHLQAFDEKRNNPSWLESWIPEAVAAGEGHGDPELTAANLARAASYFSAVLPNDRYYKEFLMEAQYFAVADPVLQLATHGESPELRRLTGKLIDVLQDHFFDAPNSDPDSIGQVRLERYAKELVLGYRAYQDKHGSELTPSQYGGALSDLCYRFEQLWAIWNEFLFIHGPTDQPPPAADPRVLRHWQPRSCQGVDRILTDADMYTVRQAKREAVAKWEEEMDAADNSSSQRAGKDEL